MPQPLRCVGLTLRTLSVLLVTGTQAKSCEKMEENFILKRNRLDSLNDLPENIILEIFTYLSVKELCIIRR